MGDCGEEPSPAREILAFDRDRQEPISGRPNTHTHLRTSFANRHGTHFDTINLWCSLVVLARNAYILES